LPRNTKFQFLNAAMCHCTLRACFIYSTNISYFWESPSFDTLQFRTTYTQRLLCAHGH